MRSKVIQAPVTKHMPKGKLLVRYECEDPEDTFILRIPMELPLTPESLAAIGELAKSYDDQQKSYIALHPNHGFEKIFSE